MHKIILCHLFNGSLEIETKNKMYFVVYSIWKTQMRENMALYSEEEKLKLVTAREER